MIELVLALIFEIVKPEPPEKIHPSVFFGRLMERLFKLLPKTKFFGFVALLIVVSTAFAVSKLPSLLPFPASVILSSYLLYSSISIRSMIEHARNCISNGKIIREEVAKIVSRDVKNLDQGHLSSAVIESVAENFVDGVLAPLLYYSIFGVSGALIYRAVNVCDAVVGYKKGEYREFGFFTAKLDDVLNFIPSRVSPILYSPKVLRCAFSKNPKFNGHSISAMACYLNVKLEKVGSYAIDCGNLPTIDDVKRSLSVFKKLSIEAVLLAAAMRVLGIYTF